jgi:hypothetical protein
MTSFKTHATCCFLRRLREGLLFTHIFVGRTYREDIRHDTTRHDTTQHNTTQHSTTRHDTTQHVSSSRPTGSCSDIKRTGLAQSLQCRRPGFDPRLRPRILPLTSVSRPAEARPASPPVQWVPGVLSAGVKSARGLKLTTHLIQCRGQ